jgi:hypothetical protein
VGLRGGLGIFEERKISCPYRKSSPGPSTCTDYATAAAVLFFMIIVTEHKFHDVACMKYDEACKMAVTNTRMERFEFLSDRFNVYEICT